MRAAHRPSPEHLDAFWEMSLDLLAIASLDGYFLHLNEAWEATLGWSRDELYSVPYRDFVHPDDLERTDGEAAEMAAQGRHSFSFENRYRTRSGEYRHLLWNSRTVLSEGLIYAVVRDVTAEGATRDEAERLAARFRSILEAAGEAIFGLDHEGAITFVNPAAAQMLDRAPDAIIGDDFHQLVHTSGAPSDAPSREECPILATLADGIPRRLDGELFRRRDGVPISVDYHAAPIRQNGALAGAVVTGTDISDRARTEEELREAKALADTASRAKSEFLSHMSHELRTPLNAILGFTQLLAMREFPESIRTEVNEELRQVRRAGQHLLDLINQMLDIARIEAGRLPLSLEPVEIDGVMDDAVELIRPLARDRNVTLETKVAPRALFVVADRQRLTQVLLNLLSNAVKYNRVGGSVTVDARREADNASTVRIQVRDTGSGIPADRLHRLFIPFERLDDDWAATEGAGLGLPLSAGLAQLMSGSIDVESEVGKGSSFTVRLPSAEPAAVTDLEVAGSSSGTAPEGAGKVLYIEDNLANLRLIEAVAARRAGIELVSAMQGRLGIELAREHRPDLILLDLHLPDVSGEEVVRELDGDPRTAACEVVIVSADATPGRIRRLLEAGATDYVTKPIDVDALIGLFDRVLTGGSEG